MPNATLGPNVLDDLVSVVDSVRADVHASLGTRQHVVTLCKRLWDGGRPGAGNLTFTQQQVISPPPLLAKWGVTGRLSPCGLEENGEVVLVEVSLTYTEAELYLPTLQAGEEFYYRIEDAHGQGVRKRSFVPCQPPYVVRSGEEGMPDHPLGWVVTLKPYDLSGVF